MNRFPLYLVLLALSFSSKAFCKEFHVSKKGNDANNGAFASPFKTIAAAVKVAYAGDTITVHAGTYREWVNPLHGGESNAKRIVYRAAPSEKVYIKGSEVVNNWKKQKNGIWKLTLPNSFFGDYNPYQDSISGDWFNGQGRIHHTGEVFLNSKSLYEKETLDKVLNPVTDKTKQDPEGSTYTWYCESNATITTIWANFHKYNPNKEVTEISCRRTCFYPDKPGINYLTISGFDISQAATQWAAPTAEQIGMVSTHWNKGWIIENNSISNSKCNGITLGKERSTGHNVWTLDKDNVERDGNIHYIEVVFNTLRKDWNKENIGSHVVRNNIIFNCEQTGICGSMGAAFSLIENNHIYNIWTKRQFRGAELGGIKFHAPVDAVIRNNRIHDSGRGLWLDWMTQGTRVSKNIFYNNDIEDFFTEVNHGPYTVDNNLFLSPVTVNNQSSGGAYIHNLFAGAIYVKNNFPRFTPYFLPHTTDVKGLSTVYEGDDRYYNNIFIAPAMKKTDRPNYYYGLDGYQKVKLKSWMEGNLYYNGAQPAPTDLNFVNAASFDPQIKLLEEGGHGYLQLKLNDAFSQNKVKIITGASLGKAKIPKSNYENPDGTPIVIDTDWFGNKRAENSNTAGPILNLNVSDNKIKIW
jgi:hypothetical protein